MSAKDIILDAIHHRRSVRNFTGEPVSKDDLQTILEAGMAAPSAVNYQPWEFVVITDRDTLNRLADGLPYAKMLYQAGAAIIVCMVPNKAFGHSPDFALIDASLAGENILLAIEALGLGAVWTAVYPDEARIDCARAILNIPLDVIPLNVIPIGHPTGEDQPKDKFNRKNIHWEKY